MYTSLESLFVTEIFAGSEIKEKSCRGRRAPFSFEWSFLILMGHLGIMCDYIVLGDFELCATGWGWTILFIISFKLLSANDQPKSRMTNSTYWKAANERNSLLTFLIISNPPACCYRKFMLSFSNEIAFRSSNFYRNNPQ